jgi:hypothetical protein
VRITFNPKPKPNPKPNRTLVDVLETMGRLVDQSLRMGPLKRLPLERSQHEYQNSRSSETALHDLVSRIESTLGHKILHLMYFWM